MAAKDAREIVIVPDVTADLLLSSAQSEAGILRLDSAFAEWDFLRDEGGKSFEVLTWTPTPDVSTEAAREYFARLGFGGNTAAFLEWLKSYRLYGWAITIPEDARLYRDRVNDLYVARLYRDEAYCRLCLARTRGTWSLDHTFVGFREVTP